MLERVQLSGFLSEQNHQLSHLNAEIFELEETLKAMKQKRDRLQGTILKHYMLLAPFRCLPGDVLREIFFHCLPDDHNALMTVVEAPLLLSRVCSRWRSIVYYTPRLWATLHIPLPRPPSLSRIHPSLVPSAHIVRETFQIKVLGHMDAVDAWICRSGCCPLSLSFHAHDRNAVSSRIKPYLEILLRHVNRWEDIDITVPLGDLSTVLAQIPSRHLPMLKRLELGFTPSPHDKRWGSSGLFNAPKLHSLRLVHLPVPVSSLDISWQNITNLALRETVDPSGSTKFISLAEAHILFRKCISLTHCSLKVADSSDAVSPSALITLTYLESLSIEDYALGMSSLFECLQVPSLRRISYHCSHMPSSRPSPLISLISCSGGQIQHLVTDLFFLTLSDLKTIFGGLPYQFLPCCDGPFGTQTIACSKKTSHRSSLIQDFSQPPHTRLYQVIPSKTHGLTFSPLNYVVVPPGFRRPISYTSFKGVWLQRPFPNLKQL